MKFTANQRRVVPSSKDWHPSERDLLLYLNGELKAKLSSRISAHLEGCWGCSARRDHLTSAISAFMQYRANVLQDDELPPRAVRQFEARLKQLASAAETPVVSKEKSLRRSWSVRGLPMGLTAAAAVLIGFFFIWLRLTSTPTVSAREVLSRSGMAEARGIESVAAPVVHQRFRVTRTHVNGQPAESVGVEIWHDTRSRRFHQRIHETSPAGRLQLSKFSSPSGGQSGETHPIVSELGDILDFNQLDRRQPLSAKAFAGWRANVRQQEEHVAETELANGSKALTISTLAAGPFRFNAIMQADFSVRRQDWHPVAQRLKVNRKDGVWHYELSESSYEVVSLNTLNPTLFREEIPHVRPADLPSPVASPPPAKRPVLDDELVVRNLLHQARACLGEEVEIGQDSEGALEVKGVVASQARQQELSRALAGVENLRFSVRTLEEIARADSAPNLVTPGPNQGVVVLPLQRGGHSTPSPVQTYLENFVSHPSPNEVSGDASGWVGWSNRVVKLSQSAYNEAWALRRLAERYDSERIARLAPKSRVLLESIIRDHLEALSQKMSRCEALLAPPLHSFLQQSEGVEKSASNPVEDVSQSGSWPALALQLFEAAVTSDRLMHALIKGTEPIERPSEAVEELLAAFSRVKADAEGMRVRIRSEVRGAVSLDVAEKDNR
ncbi:MAG: hypothetical protein AB1898_21210 [Acidobacteriota bacterium]